MKVQPQMKMFAELFLKIFSSTHKKKYWVIIYSLMLSKLMLFLLIDWLHIL